MYISEHTVLYLLCSQNNGKNKIKAFLVKLNKYFFMGSHSVIFFRHKMDQIASM